MRTIRYHILRDTAWAKTGLAILTQIALVGGYYLTKAICAAIAGVS